MDDFSKQLLDIFREEAAESVDRLAEHIEALRAGDSTQATEQIASAFRVAHNIKGAARVAGVVDVENLAHALEDVLSKYRATATVPPEGILDAIMVAIGVVEKSARGDENSQEARRVTELLRAMGSDNGVAKEVTEEIPVSETVDVPVPKRNKGKSAQATASTAVQSDVPTQQGTVGVQPVTGGGTDEVLSAEVQQEGAALGTNVSSSVRIELGRLDKVMGYAGELLISHAKQAAKADTLEGLFDDMRQTVDRLPIDLRGSFSDLRKRLDDHLRREREELISFGYLTDEIGSAMKRLRMLPVASMAPQWRSIVREAAQETGKDVRLEIEVGDVELDKHVLDSLRDPLMHLLRNAVDHGLEDTQRRKDSKKATTGRLLLRASMSGAMVHIEISDDGAGFSIEGIRRKAGTLGLVPDHALMAMTERDVSDLLFLPGFSMRDSVSHLSGRGVGLDVVRRRLAELGGSVEISDTPTLGGATFTMRVPVTRVSTRGLLVRTQRSTYALPSEHVARLLRVAASEVRQLDGAPTVNVEGMGPLRIRWLATMMDEARPSDGENLVVVVVSQGSSYIGLVVQQVVGMEEFVTQSLPWNLVRIIGVAGAVILGDGSLAVVIDIPELVAINRVGEAVAIETVQRAESKAARRILVIDDSVTSRTLERNILIAAGYEVTVAVDGEQGWGIMLQSAPDLVVSDVEMPGINGFELTRRIRSHPTLRNLPVILVTSLGNPSDLSEGAQAGANEYIVKGRFEQRQLLEAVARLV